MAKKNAKQCTAANCEAAKQNKSPPPQNVPQDDVSIVTDPSYTNHDLETNDIEPEATSQSLQALGKSSALTEKWQCLSEQALHSRMSFHNFIGSFNASICQY
ncbi:hypothetical protein B0H14DRAFT_2650882 [Mycena olivaceomarginata]|nr:hypothetical protein B0H14DRAFT_2650882 [Mycena olivaceomarginata]